MIPFLVSVLMFCLLFGLLWMLVNMLPNEPWKKFAQAAVVVLAIIIVLGWIAGIFPLAAPWRVVR